MAKVNFDEPSLCSRIAHLDARNRVAFAAACASRLLLVFEEYAESYASQDIGVLRQSVEFLWRSVISGEWQQDDIKNNLEAVMGMMPEEGDDWTPLHGSAQDAVASTAYALRALASGDPQEVGWAARRAYEAVDQLVMNQLDVNLSDPSAENKILAHPLVQQELVRQLQDVADLEERTPAEAMYLRLQERSLSQSTFVVEQ